MKNFKIKNKDNKISHGRGNTLRNKVRGWGRARLPDPLKPDKLIHNNDLHKCLWIVL